MKIEIKTNEVVYITIGNWVIYIDNITGERIIDHWIED